MAFDLSSLLDTGSVGVQVRSITGDDGASMASAGYTAFVQSVIGSAPAVRDLGNRRAKLVLNGDQNRAMQGWLDTQVRGVLSPGQPPIVDLSIGDYLTPWTLKYSAPALIGAFVAGWLLHYAMNR